MNRWILNISYATAVVFLGGIVTLGHCFAKSSLSERVSVSGEDLEKSSTDTVSSHSIRQGHFLKQDIEAMLIRPENARELLQNVRTIMKRDLLVENSFYSDALVLKVFNAANVNRKAESSNVPRDAKSQSISVVVKTTLLPGLTVTLSRSKVPTGKDIANSGGTTERFAASGYLELRVDRIPNLTVGLVREIIGNGRESEDFGNATDGGHVAVAFKGFIFYEVPRHASEAGIELARSETVIFVKRESASNEDPTASPRRWWLIDSDAIQKITMSQLEQ